jgi:hypothetical protein
MNNTIGDRKDFYMKLRNKALLLLFSLSLFCAGCRSEDESASIEKLEFRERSRTVKVGEIAAVKVKISPENAKVTGKIKYTATGRGIVEIDEALSSNDGVVFTAIGRGSTVITAKIHGFVDYLAVSVSGFAETGIPYITITDSVLEIPVGTKKHFMSTLQNGTPNDYLSFAFSNKNQDIINYETANNTAVIEGLRPGFDIITVKHPKAQYSVEVLVFVVETGEYAKYITGENAIFMETGGRQEYYTRLVGVGESESGYSVYQVAEGNDVVTVTGFGQYCSIVAKKEGVAKLRVTNRSVPYPFEFNVIVRGDDNVGYFSMSNNFVILENTEIRNIYAYYNGNSNADIEQKYTWHFENNVNDIVEVTRYGNNFALKALKNGNAKLIIENEYSLVKQEVLIQVQFEKLINGDTLITTSQNVIYMELGSVDVILKMKLVGGTLADKNSFEWVVEDSSIIEASVPDGHGMVYHRAIVNYGEVQEASAKITAKKAGTTYIKVTNPKAPRSEVRVLVKVYPKGMFNGNTVSLGGSGLLKVQRGKALDINVQLISGSYQNTGELVWHTKDESVAGITGAGLSGILYGHKEGITQVIVTGQNVLTEYHAVIVVYEEGHEDIIPYIYTDRLQYKMFAGQTVYAYIHHPNIEDDNFNISIVNTNTSVVYTVKQGGVIVLNATEPGEAELIINTGVPGCNIITITVNVELAELNTERPYTITGNSSAVTYVGGTVEYSVTMAGASTNDKSKINWSIDDSSVAELEMVNATNVIIRGKSTGQTILRAESAKSANVKEIIVFVFATQNDAYTKITLGLPKINYVVRQGESFLVKLVTNATENQKLQIRWQQSDADILALDAHYDTAFITAIEEGTCIITVDTRDNSHAMKLLMYVTVRSPLYDELQIGFPSSVALLKGQSKIIRGNVLGGGVDSFDFIWNLEDDNVAHVIGNGLEATLWGRNPGQSFLTVSYYGFSKKIFVICVENESDLENIWYFTTDKTYYRIKKDEEARINLLFGENGFPEDEKKNIKWKEDLNNGIITLSHSGANAKITGKNTGVARIIASHDRVNKDIEILIEVVDSVIGSEEYYMLFPTVNKMVKDVPKTIPISLYKDDHLYSQGYSLLNAETEGKGIVKAELLNDTLRVMGLKEGREYITLSHPLAGQRRMLAVVYEGQIPDDGDPVIYVDKQYWTVYEGKGEFIDLQIAGGDGNTQNGIMWAHFDTQIISLDSSMKIRAKIKGLSFGSTEVDILFNGKLAEKVYVSVAKGNVNTDIVVSTESIIIMALDTDTQHKTKVIGGGNTLECNWEIKNEKIAEIYGFGDQCLLYPISAGITELTVSGTNYERKIIVIVVNTEKEKMEARFLNIDKRYYKLKRGESTVIFPYYKTAKPTVPANAPILHYDSGVVSVENEGGALSITGKNEGIELLTISNDQCGNSIQIAVEVSNVISGGITENNNLVYMTTEDNIIVARPGTYGILVKVEVIGEYRGTKADFIWSKDSIIIGWEAEGEVAFINTKDQTGEVNISVENNYCQYPLKIKVIIREDNEEAGTPYVYSDKMVHRLTLSDDVLRVSFKVNNIDTVDYSQIVFTKAGSAVEISLNGNYFEVRPKTQGVCELDIQYPGAVSLKLFFIVADTIENTAVYLTTAMNYVVVPKSKIKVIDVSLMNYTELNSDNIKWYSSDFNTVVVVGTGKTVQIYGVEVGFAKLTVKHPVSYNDLEIMVKVVDEHDKSNVAYLTTNENIIETFVQNNSVPVVVHKIGGKIPEIEASWYTDDPSVLLVTGTGGIGYVLPRKAGIAKVIITERETEKLEIVVIVKEVKAGTEYIETDNPVIQISPGMGSRTIQVNLVGGGELDTQHFEWQVYSQLPSDYEVAKNGGTVISLFGMGDRAAVSGNYVGTARIRVSHPKAQLPLYIMVQVTNVNSMSFNESGAVIVNGEIYFAGIRVPNYENFTGRVEYSTDNPAVCVVTGSDKVAMLQSQGVGKANITAIVRGTSLQASIEVMVIERDNFAEPNIIVPKTTYLLNPRERPFQIEAYVQGVGVTEESRYGIKWTAALYNGSDQGKVGEAIAIYPSTVVKKPLYIGGEEVEVLQGNGPIIQIEVLNPLLPAGQEFQTKEIVIVVSQPELTSRTRTIYIKISEVSGIFTLNKSDITMETFDTTDLSCNILGGKDSDYREVVWLAETDITGREIVKVMTINGKNTRIYGVIDGTVYVTAIYRNEIAECRVQIKSSVYLKVQYETFFTYPGARGGNNQLIEIEYEVRPFTTQVMWTPRGTVPDLENPVAVITPVVQDYSTGKGKIRIDPLSEGDIELIGITNRNTVRTLIIIKNVYRLQISERRLRMQPGCETTYNPSPNKELYWDYDSKYNANTTLVDNWTKIGGSIHIPFVICPPDHRLVFNKDAIKLMNDYGIDYEISPIIKYGEMEGRGIIKLTTNKEIPSYIYMPEEIRGIALELDLIKPFENLLIDPSLYSSNPNSPNNCIYLTSQLPKHQTALIPVFQRVYGVHSNKVQTGSTLIEPKKYKFYAEDSDVYHYKDKKELTNIMGSGPHDYDINATNWIDYPTGILPEFNNATYQNSTSEYISVIKDNNTKKTYNFNTDSGHAVSYNLEIGDGEEHYILLDRTHEGMYFQIDNSETNISSFYDTFKAKEFYKNRLDMVPSAELVEIDGGTAIRIRGGEDFTVYDRVNVKNQKQFSFMYFSPNQNTLEHNTDVSKYADIYNHKTNVNQFNEDIGDKSGAIDYSLVKQFGIPLNTTAAKIINYEDMEEFDDNLVLNVHVRNQIIYLRWGENGKDRFHPIRVQYNYTLSCDENGIEEILSEISVIENPGGSFDSPFTNAKEFFKQGPLYVTKDDSKGVYYIKDQIYNSQGNFKQERIQEYGRNTILSNINANRLNMNQANTVTHANMVTYNPHYHEIFNDTLYIVSDFDLEDKGIVWYTTYNNGVYNLAFPNISENNTMLVELGITHNRSAWFTANRYCRIFFRLKDMNNKALGNNEYIIWDDHRYDYTGDYQNYNSGKGHYFDFEYMAENVIFFNQKSLFKDKSDFAREDEARAGYFTPKILSWTTASINQINYLAIQEALRHNMEKIADSEIRNLANTEYINNTSFQTAINKLTQSQKNTIYSLMYNEKGSIMGNYRESDSTGGSYKNSTLYVKRTVNKNFNKVYNISDLQMNNIITGHNLGKRLGDAFYWSKSHNMITEDITGNDDYVPLATENNNILYSSDPVRLIITYRNSYSSSNTIIINITHKIRGNNNMGISNRSAAWEELKAVNKLDAELGGSGNFSKYFGYFFVKDEKARK